MLTRLPFLFFMTLVAAQTNRCAWANQVAFAVGDASFIGLVDQDSNLLKDDLILQAVTTFCCGRTPDFVKGCQLDLAKLPPEQIASMRKTIRELIDADAPNKAVLLCVCDPKFDFTKTWLGIHYNRKRYRTDRLDTVTNCFGPPGAATLSSRDASNIPPLTVEFVTEERFKVVGEVALCIISLNHAILQRIRSVISADGTVRPAEFNYNPVQRVCFEDGDAFFVAKADAALDATANTTELEYYTFPRISYHSLGNPLNGNQFQLNDAESEAISKDIPIRPKGQRLSITGIPKKLSSQLVGLPNRRWFVFVMDVGYDPLKYKLGRRYNAIQLQDVRRPLQLEFSDCNYCTETFPVGDESDPWPTSLKVKWEGDLAVARMEDVKLVLVQYWDNVRFYSDADSVQYNHYRITQRKFEHWTKGKLLEEISF